MINHVSIGVADIDRSRAFYNAALGVLSYGLNVDGEDSLGYGAGLTEFWVLKSAAPPAPAAAGTHFCFDAPSRDTVVAFHNAAITYGGIDNGAPGLRPEYGADYYAAGAVADVVEKVGGVISGLFNEP